MQCRLVENLKGSGIWLVADLLPGLALTARVKLTPSSRATYPLSPSLTPAPSLSLHSPRLHCHHLLVKGTRFSSGTVEAYKVISADGTKMYTRNQVEQDCVTDHEQL
jgi:hypothetical protein